LHTISKFHEHPTKNDFIETNLRFLALIERILGSLGVKQLWHKIVKSTLVLELENYSVTIPRVDPQSYIFSSNTTLDFKWQNKFDVNPRKNATQMVLYFFFKHIILSCKCVHWSLFVRCQKMKGVILRCFHHNLVSLF